MVNGHVYPQAEQRTDIRFKQQRLLYWNVGGKFIDVSRRAGAAIGESRSSRGSAAGDLDNDGSLEIVVSNIGDPPSLLKNVGPRQHWLLIDLVGTKAARDAVGARIAIVVAGRRLSGELQSGNSYLSHNDRRLHFGLGGASRYDRIEVQWLGGAREVFPGGEGNRVVVLKEGTGAPP
jgi:hypothetical protein